MSIHLIVGLGNFLEQYLNTKHNVGFMVIDRLCKALSINLNNDKFNGRFVRIAVDNEDYIIAKPYTYMNLSGNFVQAIVHFYKINLEHIWVIADDADSNIGTMRIRTSGASGGQNGLKDIIQKLSSDNFNRIKIGIGRPHNKNKNLADYVLEPFVNEDKRKIDKVIDKAVEVLIDLMNGKSVTALMNNYNITVK